MINSISSFSNTPYIGTIRGEKISAGLRQQKEFTPIGTQETFEALEGKAGNVDFNLRYNNYNKGLIFETKNAIVNLDKNGNIESYGTKNKDGEFVDLKPIDIQA